MDFSIKKLSDEEVTKVTESKPAKRKKVKGIDLHDRTINTWFKLYHRLEDCNYCERRRMTGTLDGIKRICRYCFLEGKGVPVDGITGAESD